MNSALTFTLIVLASMTVARADDDINQLAFKYYSWNEAWKGAGQTCAQYGRSCVFYGCCQYPNRGRIDCFSGQCLQAQCGYPGQHCGTFIGECCYHLGLSCVTQGHPWVGICSPPFGPVYG